MGLLDLTPEAVNAAIDEYEELGGETFRRKYGFAPAKDYFIIRDGNSYDSKAIAGAAHGYLSGRRPLRPDEFSGGEATVVRRLRQLGFRVPPKRSPPWNRDEVILACDLVAQNGWQYLTADDPRVIELSALLQRMPFHSFDVRSDTFRNPNGVARKTVDIATHHPDYAKSPTKGGAIDEVVLSEFLEAPERMHEVANALRSAAANDSLIEKLTVPSDEETDEASEGRLLQRQHFVRERNRELRRKKVAEFLKSNPKVFCEVCGFDFESVYGDRGREYIEVHHVLPLHASGETTTKLRDLVLLCSNCHRMIHRSTPWLSPEDLRGLINEPATESASGTFLQS